MPIELKQVDHIYAQGTPFASAAIQQINLLIENGEYIGLIGHTGSGKSTLIQHLNGLLSPTAGTVVVDGVNITQKGADMKTVRQRVGMVFQYPEHQLFEETVERDVAFGPKNMKLDQAEVQARVTQALEWVGLDTHHADKRSPFELSGGQRRRVAIAGVLAMHPQTLVLDEPTAGLDPRGREEILSLVERLHRQQGMTIVLVTHHMDDVARYASRIVVMNHGQVALSGSPHEVFQHADTLREIGLGVPESVELITRLNERGMNLPLTVYELSELADRIVARWRGDSK